MKAFIYVMIFIHCDTVTSKPLEKSQKFNLYIETRDIHIDPVVAEIYTIIFEHVIFEQGLEKRSDFKRLMLTSRLQRAELHNTARLKHTAKHPPTPSY